MPQSQLKRLKASLRTAGVTGQQKPKKAKNKRNTTSGPRLDKSEALARIREEFNPFEIKTTREKHAIIGGKRVKGREGRPAQSKQIGEENRKRTLLVAMQKRNKVGGIVDRRFGENDPTMTPEDRMLERFAREKQKRMRGGGDLFNLENDNDLTHFGQSLGGLRDDFDDGGNVSDSADGSEKEGPTLASRKRLLEEDDEGKGSDLSADEEDGKPEKKRSKAEVMKEVMSKSKLYKYERQKAKEDDEKEREKLDAEMGDLWTLLGQRQPSSTGAASGANNIPLGVESAPLEKDASGKHKPDEYDQAVREMMFDKRSNPTERTKTEEEKAAEESERLKKLEEARQRRMRGDESDDDDDDKIKNKGRDDDDDHGDLGDAHQYGLGKGIPAPNRFKEAGLNPDELVEGDYEISNDGYVDVDEDGNVDGDAEFSDDFEEDNSLLGSQASCDSDDEEEEEFLANIKDDKAMVKASGDKLAFTFPCPQTHAEMLKITKDISTADIPTVVQRIRVLHHSNLAAGNKEKLEAFSAVLVEHIAYVANLTAPATPFVTIDFMIRHLHAMAKTYPDRVAEAFRTHLTAINADRINDTITAGDLVLLTAIGTIFSTSDHFHVVVTPAMLVITRWLAQVIPTTTKTLAVGSYLITLCIQYQRISKRYIPEAINFILLGLSLLAPSPLSETPGNIPYHATDTLRLKPSAEPWRSRKLAFSELFCAVPDTSATLVYTFAGQLSALCSLWTGRSAFEETFQPALPILKHLTSKKCGPIRNAPLLKSALAGISKLLITAILHAHKTRRPLELHHHRPLPIPSNIPKFEDDYNPDKKSHDPDADRREISKLRAEHKRERKGAMRELRKDSHFISRTQLKENKEKSEAYHKKMAQLQAWVQTDEGTAGNEYKRMRARKGRG